MVKIYGVIYVNAPFSLRECKGKVKHFFMEKKIVLEILILQKLYFFFVTLFFKPSKVNAMYLDEIRTYCLAKAETTEALPFDEETLVFKVAGKIFLLTHISDCSSINLKCAPDYAQKLREEYEEIQPGYHMNKKMWNTVSLKGNLTWQFIKELIDHSYEEVVNGLKKADRERLKPETAS